jgi:hypothetical protein
MDIELSTSFKGATQEYDCACKDVDRLQMKAELSPSEEAGRMVSGAKNAQLAAGRKMNDLSRRRTILGYVGRVANVDRVGHRDGDALFLFVCVFCDDSV